MPDQTGDHGTDVYRVRHRGVSPMNLARIAVLAVALGAGGLAAILAGRGGEEAEIVVERIEVSSVEVLVAAEDVPMGQSLSDADLAWQAWPTELADDRYIIRSDSPDAIEELSGAVVRFAFLAGEPINEAKIVRAERGFMSAILPKGMRAISIEISPETGAGGFILPNDRVDVILTQSDEQAESAGSADPYITETLLHNVRVLAIDQTIEEQQDGQKVVVGKTATLELRPDQTEVLALAERLGELSLSLRSVEDFDEGDGGPITAGANGERRGVTVMRFGRSQRVMTR